MKEENKKTEDLGLILAMLLGRIWLGIRSLQTGIEKFAGTKGSEELVTIDGAANSYGLTESAEIKSYALSHYHGVPEGLYSKLAEEPLIPGWSLAVYDWLLGPLLLILGVTVLLGIATRLSLFVMGLVYTSLTFGLILLKQDAGVAWLAVHLLMIMAALYLSPHNRIAVTRKW